MSFYKEVGAPFGLTESQATQFELGLEALERSFQQLNQDEHLEKSTAENLYHKFESLVQSSGIEEENLETLVNHLYFTESFSSLVTWLIKSYYDAGGDLKKFEQTYQLILHDA